uniref:OST-HTH associated domain-containing protein n=1 Tax=Kalanchoe fedtschenkoi TaxID=63787 RepID=A0A7N1A8C0_KALFE
MIPENPVLGNPNFPPIMGRVKDRQKWKQPQRFVNQSGMSHTVSMPVGTQGHMDSVYPQHAGFGHAQANQFHQIYDFRNANNFASRPPPNIISSSFDSSRSTASNFNIQSGYQQPHAQPMRPIPNILPIRPASAPRTPFSNNPPHHTSQYIHSRPGGHNFASSPITSVPDIGKLNMSENASKVHGFQHQKNDSKKDSTFDSLNIRSVSAPQIEYLSKGELTSYGTANNGHSDVNPSASSSQVIASEGIQNGNIDKNRAMENVVGGTSECYKMTDDVNASMENIVLALNTLRKEKIAPTEANITDCILYGNLKVPKMHVKKAIESALEHQLIEKRNLGSLQFYVGKNERLWKCTNPTSGNPNQYPTETWDKIKKFLIDRAGRVAIMESNCRYEVGIILRNLCLEELLLGDVLQILDMVISFKKWISYNHSGWQPITINLPESDPDLEDKGVTA